MKTITNHVTQNDLPKSRQERVMRLEGAASATAHALLRRSDIKVMASGYAAKWDWRNNTLHVPAFSLRATADSDPRLTNAWRGTLDHECAHVEFTDAALLEEALAVWERDEGEDGSRRIFLLANAYEDSRIERLWARKNIGSARYLSDMHGYVSDTTGRGAATDPEMVLATGKPLGMFGALIQAITRLDLGYITADEVHPMTAQLLGYLGEEIQQGVDATTLEEVIVAANSTYQKLKELSNDSPNGEEGEDEAEGSEGGGDGQQDGQEEEGEGDPQGDQPGEGGEDEGEGDNQPGEGEGEEGEGDDDGEGEGKDDGQDEQGDGKPPGQDGGQFADWGKGGGDKATEGVFESAEGGDKPEAGVPSGEAPPDQTSHGAQVGDDIKDLAANCVEGEWGELPSDAEVIAGEYLADPENRIYTAHPDAQAQDIWETFSAEQRAEGRKVLRQLKSAAGLAVGVLSSNLREVIKAMKQTLFVGGLEDGEYLDNDALADVALGLPTEAIYADYFAQTDESVYIGVLVDDSGSMGDNKPESYCPDHGAAQSKSGNCQRRKPRGGKCGKELQFRVDSKSGYAAIMAMALHESLRMCGVPHCVLGHHNTGGYWHKTHHGMKPFVHPDLGADAKITLPNGESFQRWSRYSTRMVISEYVPSPGINDDGSALPYITGRGANLDGEAVLEAAKYMAKHAGDKDRCILFVVADGYPAGANDRRMEQKNLQRAVEKVAESGIEVYGIGVGTSKRQFAQYYPDRPATSQRAATGSVIIPSNGSGIGRTVLTELISLIAQSLGYSRKRVA